MPNIKSAVKRVEITRKRTIRNTRIKSALKTTIRRFEEAMKVADRDEAGLEPDQPMHQQAQQEQARVPRASPVHPKAGAW